MFKTDLSSIVRIEKCCLVLIQCWTFVAAQKLTQIVFTQNKPWLLVLCLLHARLLIGLNVERYPPQEQQRLPRFSIIRFINLAVCVQVKLNPIRHTQTTLSLGDPSSGSHEHRSQHSRASALSDSASQNVDEVNCDDKLIYQISMEMLVSFCEPPPSSRPPTLSVMTRLAFCWWLGNVSLQLLKNG